MFEFLMKWFGIWCLIRWVGFWGFVIGRSKHQISNHLYQMKGPCPERGGHGPRLGVLRESWVYASRLRITWSSEASPKTPAAVTTAKAPATKTVRRVRLR